LQSCHFPPQLHCDELADLVVHTFTPGPVGGKPFIDLSPGKSPVILLIPVTSTASHPLPPKVADCGDLLSHGLRQSTLIVFWMSILPTLTPNKDFLKVLASHEKSEKFSCFLSGSAMPFQSFHCLHMASVIDKLKWCQLATKFVCNIGKPYSVICGFMHNCISIAILHATHHCLSLMHCPVSCMSVLHPSAVWCRSQLVYPQYFYPCALSIPFLWLPSLLPLLALTCCFWYLVLHWYC